MYSWVLVNNTEFMIHLVDNIIDVTVHDNNNNEYKSFIANVVYFSDMKILKCVINNRCINKATLIIKEDLWYNVEYDKTLLLNKLLQLINYLDDVSLNRFIGYYNLEKYYHVIPMMLLVIKVQTVLPKCIIKYLIIPFIYR